LGFKATSRDRLQSANTGHSPVSFKPPRSGRWRHEHTLRRAGHYRHEARAHYPNRINNRQSTKFFASRVPIVPIIRFSATASVFDFRRSDEGDLVEDRGVLRTLHGLTYTEESFSDYLLDGSETRELAGLGISGGELKFEFDSQVGGLVAHTEYLAPRFLTETEIEALRGYTVGQWSDGIGSNFFQERMADGLAPQVLIANEQAVRAEQFD
jgi:hypothetical protein